jgi:hypothetical protein
VGLGAASGDIGTPAPNGRHNMQFFGDLLQSSILGKPLKRINYGLLVRHAKTLFLCCAVGKLLLSVAPSMESLLRTGKGPRLAHRAREHLVGLFVVLEALGLGIPLQFAAQSNGNVRQVADA